MNRTDRNIFIVGLTIWIIGIILSLLIVDRVPKLWILGGLMVMAFHVWFSPDEKSVFGVSPENRGYKKS